MNGHLSTRQRGAASLLEALRDRAPRDLQPLVGLAVLRAEGTSFWPIASDSGMVSCMAAHASDLSPIKPPECFASTGSALSSPRL